VQECLDFSSEFYRDVTIDEWNRLCESHYFRNELWEETKSARIIRDPLDAYALLNSENIAPKPVRKDFTCFHKGIETYIPRMESLDTNVVNLSGINSQQVFSDEEPKELKALFSVPERYPVRIKIKSLKN